MGLRLTKTSLQVYNNAKYPPEPTTPSTCYCTAIWTFNFNLHFIAFTPSNRPSFDLCHLFLLPLLSLYTAALVSCFLLWTFLFILPIELSLLIVLFVRLRPWFTSKWELKGSAVKRNISHAACVQRWWLFGVFKWTMRFWGYRGLFI